MIGRWQDRPRLERLIVGAFVLLLAYGTAVHLLQLVANGFARTLHFPAGLWRATSFGRESH